MSIYSDERGKELVMEGLKAKTKYVRAGLGKRMQLRLTPEVRFIMDESLEKGSRVHTVYSNSRSIKEFVFVWKCSMIIKCPYLVEVFA